MAGRLQPLGDGRFGFVYGRSFQYLPQAVPLGLDLPLAGGLIVPTSPSMSMPGTIRDACPDAWGQRVSRYLLTGEGQSSDPDWPTVMLASESNRTGALDFQASRSPTRTVGDRLTDLTDVLRAVDDVTTGEPLDPIVAAVLLHGPSVGGPGPKPPSPARTATSS